MADPRTAAARAEELVRGGQTVLVVAQRRSRLLHVAGALAAAGVPFRMITGGVTGVERAAVVELAAAQPLAVLATDGVLGVLALRGAELVHADDVDALPENVRLQRINRVNRPWVRQRIPLARRDGAPEPLTDGDRAARATALARHSGDRSPLRALADTGAITDAETLLAEVDACLDSAARMADLYPEEDYRPALEALREYVLLVGARAAVPGWPVPSPAAA